MWQALLSVFIVAMIITQAGLALFTIAWLLYQALFAKADELGRF